MKDGESTTTTGQSVFESDKREHPDWPAHQYDRANTAHKSNTDVPKSGVKIAWERDLSTDATTGPVVSEGTVYVGTPTGIEAVDAANGESLWTYEGFETPEVRTLTPPAVAPETALLTIGSGRDVHAVDATSGEKRWEFSTSGEVSTPVPVENKVYVGSNDEHFYTIDDQGTRERYFRAYNRVRVPPAVVGDTICLMTGHVFRVFDRKTGDERWSVSLTGTAGTTAPTVRDGNLFVGAGNTLYGYELAALKRLATDEDTEDLYPSLNYGTSSLVANSPVVTDRMVYASDASVDNLHAIDIASGERQWKFSALDRITGTVVADETAFVAADQLYAVDVSDGTERWRFDTSGVPAIVDGTLYLVADGTAYALEAEA